MGPRDRLAEAIDDRRTRLTMTLEQVAAAMGKGRSVAHLRRVRTGKVELTPAARAEIESALQWTAGTVTRVLSGEMSVMEAAGQGLDSPAPAGESADQVGIRQATAIIETLRQQLAAVEADRAFHARVLERLDDLDRKVDLLAQERDQG